ncbi:hypothetical protein C5167_002897, partial [Papaver somniferum]
MDWTVLKFHRFNKPQMNSLIKNQRYGASPPEEIDWYPGRRISTDDLWIQSYKGKDGCLAARNNQYYDAKKIREAKLNQKEKKKQGTHVKTSESFTYKCFLARYIEEASSGTFRGSQGQKNSMDGSNKNFNISKSMEEANSDCDANNSRKKWLNVSGSNRNGARRNRALPNKMGIGRGEVELYQIKSGRVEA